MKKILPVFNIDHFRHFGAGGNFYADTLKEHLRHHHFIAKPHRHDFYLAVLFTQGSGVHEVDFNAYKVLPGCLFLLSPGQVHYWQLSDDAAGFIFFHTGHFFDENFTSLRLKDFAFFSSVYNPPLLRLKKALLLEVKQLFEEIVTEHKADKPMREQRIAALLSLLYTGLSRSYGTGLSVDSRKYLLMLRLFESLLDKNFKDIKSPQAYAAMMKITERHLNRITRTCLSKTPSDLILGRVVLEARRLLMQPGTPISGVAEVLGYPDHSYFSRLFKKKTGITAKDFAAGYH